jgi:hypothetical protein
MILLSKYGEAEDSLFRDIEPHTNVPSDVGDIGSTQELQRAPFTHTTTKPGSGSVSGLNWPHRKKARQLTMNALNLGYRHAPAIHYTMGSERWQGIDQNKKAYRGEYPTQCDCSSFATWAIWNGLSHYHVRDTVNGAAWKAGYTGTMLTHGKQVHSSRNWRRGDCFIYGSAFPGKHVAVYIGGGFVISHGSEGGPFKLRWNYRGDLMQVRRYI